MVPMPHPPPHSFFRNDRRALAATLVDLADVTTVDGPWRSGAFAAVADSGVLAGFIPQECGGTGLTEAETTALLVSIAERCLTTALVLTQWAAAVRIIASSPDPGKHELLPPLARGESPTTVGISHLTTSRRHLGRPALVATRSGDGWSLDGECPWVTGADAASSIVTGAATEGGGQAFFVVPTTSAGLTIAPPLKLLALAGSRTSPVTFRGVRPAHVLGSPPDGGPRTGGLSTTALAVGAARASAAVIASEAAARPGLTTVAREFGPEIEALESRVLLAARDGIDPAARDRLRVDATSLVLRTAQASLTAAKGAGFVAGHPAERLVRESLFFLVWSCPQAVADAVLCDLAGV